MLLLILVSSLKIMTQCIISRQIWARKMYTSMSIEVHKTFHWLELSVQHTMLLKQKLVQLFTEI